MERSEEVEGKEILACEAYLDEDLAKKRSFLFQEEWDFLKRRRRVPKGITHRPDQLLRRRTRDRNFFIFLTSFSTRNEETLVGFARLAYDLPYLSFFFFLLLSCTILFSLSFFDRQLVHWIRNECRNLYTYDGGISS